MSISGTVCILVVFLIRTAAVNALPKKTFYVLWGIVLLRLLIPLRIPSEISVYSWMPQQLEEIGKFIDKNRADFAEPKQNGQNPYMQSPNRQNLDDQNRNMWEQSTQNADDQLKLNPLERIHDTYGIFFSESYLGQWLFLRLGVSGIRILEVVWTVGCVVSFLFFIFIYTKCRLNFSKSRPVDNDFCNEFVKAYKGRRLIQVRQSKAIKAPLTYGLLHPVILMPESTDWENHKQLKYVFMHEYIHIRRFDVVTKMVLIFALSIHWFNPFVWLMYFLYNRDLELSCDEMVVHAFGESSKSEYARILIDMEEERRKPMPLCNGFSKNAMEERIVAIMKMKKRTMTAIVSAAMLVCGVAGVFATSAKAANSLGTDIQKSEEKNSGASDRGLVAGSSNADGTKRFKITNISLNLSNDQADLICQEICEHMSSKYEGIYSFDHYDVTFCNEVVNGDQMSLDIDLSVKMTLIRNPKKSPFVKGMRQAIKEIKGAKKKKAARNLYKEYLNEVMPYYQKPEDTGFSYYVRIPVASVAGDEEFKFELYYRSTVDGELLGSFSQEGKFEDTYKKEEGKAYIMENL